MTEAPIEASPNVPGAPVDPLTEIQKLREANRWWRRRAFGVGGAFVFLFVLSLVQFMGTFLTCQLLNEARREAAKANRETMEHLRELREARQQIQSASDDAVRSVDVMTRFLSAIEEHEATQKKLDALRRESEDLREKAANLNKMDKEREDAAGERRKRVLFPGPGEMEKSDKECPFPIRK
ncbi:MAG: hypothetical protein K2R98_13660 [Gemmataceae bacterium]|nr:hypothetical protein [Gemmataceae bacterium]